MSNYHRSDSTSCAAELFLISFPPCRLCEEAPVTSDLPGCASNPPNPQNKDARGQVGHFFFRSRLYKYPQRFTGCDTHAVSHKHTVNTRGRCRGDSSTVTNVGLQPGLKTKKTLREPSSILSGLGYRPNPRIPQMNVTEPGRRVCGGDSGAVFTAGKRSTPFKTPQSYGEAARPGHLENAPPINSR